MMGRWVAGLGVGALSLLVPMYQGEYILLNYLNVPNIVQPKLDLVIFAAH